MILYDLETLNTDKANLYCVIVYKFLKISGKYHKDKTPFQYQKCLEVCIVFTGVNCVSECLDHALIFKREFKRVDNKYFEQKFCMIAHNGSEFDTYLVLNN